MREIEFRAWDIEKKKYKYPKLWDNTMPSNWDKHYILEQYTGLKDKNKTKIFEGDLVQLENSVRVFEFFMNCFWLIHPQKGFKFPINMVTEDYLKSIEVIGNIHQHKHLL